MAQVITITDTQVSGCAVIIKLVEGYTVPQQIETSSIQSFNTWDKESYRFFVWTTNDGLKRSMLVPRIYIAWLISNYPVDIEGNNFCINNECVVTIEDEPI